LAGEAGGEVFLLTAADRDDAPAVVASSSGVGVKARFLPLLVAAVGAAGGGRGMPEKAGAVLSAALSP
jgi:hypothetical protein